MERLGGEEGFSLSQTIDYVAFSQTVAMEMDLSNQTQQWQPCLPLKSFASVSYLTFQVLSVAVIISGSIFPLCVKDMVE